MIVVERLSRWLFTVLIHNWRRKIRASLSEDLPTKPTVPESERPDGSEGMGRIMGNDQIKRMSSSIEQACDYYSVQSQQSPRGKDIMSIPFAPHLFQNIL